MQVKEIDVDGFASARDGFEVLDVRSPEEFASGHVPGAVNVPLPGLGAVAGRFAGQRVFVICQSGGRSATAARTLTAAGADATSVAGGTAGWLESGRRVDTGL
ncbi:MAG: rhodanese-like domain-containing protein [Pseudonocardia sp.]|uniref:rhodanese-like domain-containing protein n=1 Tax=unclassified Pseudonocardia TaxID=2619320 RepID=UPI001AC3D410|nr:MULTISPECIES: rhodanese-like domain-containing protein [unclassified Pseudonocardia]MBN9109746.1 rhodanese-like domain-containing protein [Pseudonocardia sp.]